MAAHLIANTGSVTPVRSRPPRHVDQFGIGHRRTKPARLQRHAQIGHCPDRPAVSRGHRTGVDVPAGAVARLLCRLQKFPVRLRTACERAEQKNNPAPLGDAGVSVADRRSCRNRIDGVALRPYRVARLPPQRCPCARDVMMAGVRRAVSVCVCVILSASRKFSGAT